jgi:hypothetical protein
VNGILSWLSRANHHGSSAIVLGVGNLIVGVTVVPFSQLARRVPIPLHLILIWSLAYCITYFSFLNFPTLVPLSLVMIGQALAPTIAVLLTGDFRKDSLNWQSFMVRSYPVLLLILLAALHSSHFGYAAIAVTFGIALCFTASQWSARKLASLAAPFHVCSSVALLNGIFLVSLILVNPVFGKIRFEGTLTLHCIFFSIGILAIQGTYLTGIRAGGALASSLLLSAGVPVSILLEGILDRRIDYVSWCVSIAYLFLTYWTTKRTLTGQGSNSPQGCTETP